LIVLKEHSDGRDFIWFESFQDRRKYIYVYLGGISPEMKASKPKRVVNIFSGGISPEVKTSKAERIV